MAYTPSLAVENPLLLALAGLALLPWLTRPFQTLAYSYSEMLPADPVSLWLERGLKLAGTLAILSLSLGLAGLYQPEQTIERIGSGANLVLLLDRSRSMDDSFAGRTPSGAEVSKSNVAGQLLTQFLEGRPHDRVGVAAFSTAPLFVLPLTDSREAVSAAVRASARPALAQTHVGKGLAMALSYFEGPNTPESGLILLVSDGAAVIDPPTEALLRQAFTQKNLRLYWIYLRSQGSPGLFETPANPDEDNAQSRPERYLHLFFNSLKVPYQAYEAENPDSVRQALEDINRLENKPFHYSERIPRRDLQGTCYAVAAFAIGLLTLAKWQEVRG